MPNNPLFYRVTEPHPTNASLVDQVQMALAIAEPGFLQSLLVNCLPAIAHPHTIGEISVAIGVPVADQQIADAILRFESIGCVLAPLEARRDRHLTAVPTPCESETHTLAQNLSLAQMITSLNQVGFSSAQVKEILNLSSEAVHKSWWYAIDAAGQFTQPFRRLIRLLRYPDGTLTLQYKDHYATTKPTCFHSVPHQVLVKYKPEAYGFGETLHSVNFCRHHLGIHHTLLLCNTIAELEAQALMSQGMSLYPASDLVLPTRANCTLCATHECPMNGQADSPVAVCYRFCLPSHYV